MRESLIISFLIITLNLFSQERDITRFLDFPIGGKKSEMVKNIKTKGFKTAKFENNKVLTGKFNGEDVYVDVITNEKDEVCRIIVWDKNSRSENKIRIRYNNLCYRFNESSKYVADKDWSISEDEDISYALKYGKKDYQAIFFQMPTEVGDSIIKNQVLGHILLKQLNGQNEGQSDDELHQDIEKIYLEMLSKLVSKKRVWFTILEKETDRYTIVMYYENVYNMPNGDDL